MSNIRVAFSSWPAPAERFEVFCLDGQRADEAGGRGQRMESPERGRLQIAGNAHQLRRPPGGQRHFNFGQRIGDPFAGRFQIGLLARPAMEKRLRKLILRQVIEQRVFVRGKESGGDLVDFRNRKDAFDVNAECGLARHGEEGQAVRVRQVEMKRLSVPDSSQNRLAA